MIAALFPLSKRPADKAAPLSHGVSRVEDALGERDRRCDSQWLAVEGRAQRAPVPDKTLRNRLIRRSRLGAFARIFAVFAGELAAGQMSSLRQRQAALRTNATFAKNASSTPPFCGGTIRKP